MSESHYIFLTLVYIKAKGGAKKRELNDLRRAVKERKLKSFGYNIIISSRR
jgi:hypothetical protein